MRCNKITFETKSDALEDIKYQHSQHIFRRKSYANNKKNGVKTYPYLCSNCNRWHLTTKNQKLHKKQIKQRDKELRKW